MSFSTDNHALVLGASGINGWAIVREIINGYPAPNTFRRVTALTNRPLPEENRLWPKDDRLQVVSGLDLMKGSESDLESAFKENVRDIETVTQVYFYAYRFDADPNVESRVNMEMLSRTVKAIEALSPRLSYVVLPTGTKAYGVHLLDRFPFSNDLPVKESLPRIPEPYRSQMFYYHEVDELDRLSKGKKWTWCDIRPDFVVGYVPNNNVYCIAQTLGIYLSIFASINGPGATVPFPGTEGSWKAKFTPSSQDLVARFSIYASLLPERTGGRAFNVCDDDEPTTWSELWPVICSYFGLKAGNPDKEAPQPGKYIGEHLAEWKKTVEEKGLRKGVAEVDAGEGKSGYQYFLMTLFNFDRQCDLKASRDVGFLDKVPPGKSFTTAFDRFREGKAIP